MENRQNIIQEKSFAFAVRVIKLYKYLVEEKREYTLSKQLLRSGTSVGANIEEALGGYTKKDFRAKMSISYKEIRETKYWLRLLNETDYITQEQFNSLHFDAEELAKMLFKIIQNSKS
ncbi:MAG: four helix bundle protein [Brumimicrobium sp.]